VADTITARLKEIKVMKKLISSRTVVRLVFLTLLASVVYIVIKLILAPSGSGIPDSDVRVKSDYALMLLQCGLGMGVMLLPGLLERKLRIVIPSGMLVAFSIFLFCGVYLGEVHYFYFRVPHWDTMLHTFSGFALGAVGLSIIGILNKSESVPLSLSPAFIAVFAFCFAVSIGVIWEIYEFAVDSVAGLNMQKYMLESGEMLIGRAALADTMKDLIVDALGALVISVVGYVSMKNKEGWLENIQIRIDRPAPEPSPVYVAIPLTAISQPAITAAEAGSVPESIGFAS